MKLTLMTLGLAATLFACAAEESTETETQSAEPTVTPEPTPAPSATTTATNATTAESLANEKRVLDICTACGPLPDPWREISGPLPDPWKSAGNTGAADPHK